jgi:putative hemolysin
MNHNDNNLRIDIEGIISSKNPKLLKVIPRFLINLIKKLIHQKEINKILENHGHLKGKEFASATLSDLGIKYRIHGIDNIDIKGRYMFVSNHPLGGLDGMILIEVFGEMFESVKFVVNDLLMHIEPLRSVFVPVNKYGKQKVDNAKLILDAYISDAQILYFPAGLCSRLIDGEIKDLDWKKNFVNQAIKHGRDIVPVFFGGKNSSFFYRFANIRKSLGIKFNYETILLPHEMFRQRNATFDIFIGKPITHEMILSEGSPAFWSEKLRSEVYNLNRK